jgi:hypothetical protein
VRRHPTIGLAVAMSALSFTAMLTAASGAAVAVDARSCPQVAPAFRVEILGNRDRATYWLREASKSAGIPDGRTVVVVWSLGGPLSSNGVALHSWTTVPRARFSLRCARAAPTKTPPKTTGLGPKVKVKDGWNYGWKLNCQERGRIVVEVRDLPGGRRVTVRMQARGRVIAVAEVKNGGGWLRGSKRCSGSSS